MLGVRQALFLQLLLNLQTYATPKEPDLRSGLEACTVHDTPVLSLSTYDCMSWPLRLRQAVRRQKERHGAKMIKQVNNTSAKVSLKRTGRSAIDEQLTAR